MLSIPSLLASVTFATGAVEFSKSALLTPEQATAERIAALAAEGFETIVLPIAPDAVTRLAEKSGDEWVPTGLDSHARSSELFVHADVAMGRRASRICFGFRDGLKAAAARVREGGLKLGFWFEVARQPALAEAFPDLLASLRSGAPWTRRFENAPADDSTHVIKCWPWLPATSLETLVLHQAWICPLAKQLPLADFVFLNDLQGGPSACGCGNLQCRWISDYGEKQTSTPTGPDAAARLVESVRTAFLRPEIVPVWTSE